MRRRTLPILLAGLATLGGAAALVGGALPAAAAEPAISVAPATGLRDLQTVTITGTDFPPDAGVGLSQCNLLNGLYGGVCYGATRLDLDTNAQGGFTATFVVRRVIAQAGSQVDCAVAPGTCGIVAAGSDTPPVVSAPLTFDPGLPATPPAITVSPDRDVVAGQEVTVTGEHFTPDAAVGIHQCLQDTVGLESCDPSFGSEATTDSSGSFQTTFTLRDTITLTDAGATPAVPPGPHSCAAADDCSIAAANARGASEYAAAPLRFVPAPTTPPTTNPELAFSGAGAHSGLLAAAGLALVLLGAALISRTGLADSP
jgi:hypothetical protein